jgi:sugar phosphate isomerase/epimerase
VRLASPLPRTWDSPAGWIDALREHGFRAAYWPLADDAGDAEVDAYAEAARAAGVVIAEIGAWHANPISPDDATRARGMERCRTQLALADRVGARCCVNVAGSRGEAWDAPHPDNLSADTFALIVDSVREILDAVQPARTYYTLEPMPFTLPDSPDSYLALLRAIDRPRFAVHLDPVNFVTSPAKLYDNAALLRECFAKLGPHIRSVHAKDVLLEPRLTVHVDEVRPGLGVLDHAVLLREVDRLDPDTPLLVEHLRSDADYAQAVAHIRGVADSLGLAV